MLFDSEFLIRYSGQRGKVSKETTDKFVVRHLDAPLYTSRVCWAEFAEGCDTIALVEKKLGQFAVLEIDERVAWEASRISRALDRSGQHIGDNDIWIAATALAYSLPLVSRNARHFKRITGLELVEY